MTPNHIKILYVLNAISLCAVFALSFLYIHSSRQSLRVGPVGVTQSDMPVPQQVANVTVGNNSDNPAARKQGPITQIAGGVLTITDRASGQTYAVSTNADTKVVLIGSQKDPAAYQKEMDAYYAQVKLLMQDTAKNKDALAALAIPVPVELKPGALTDLASGDTVEAVAASPIAGKSFTAIKIIKSPSAAK